MTTPPDASRIRWTPARVAAATAMVALAALIVAWHAWLVVPSIWVRREVAIVLHSIVLWPGLFLLALIYGAGPLVTGDICLRDA